jgi:hypothetical protein
MEITVIQADSLVPIINSRSRGEAVAGGLGRILIIVAGNRQGKCLAGVIEEIIIRSPMHGAVIRSSERRHITA